MPRVKQTPQRILVTGGAGFLGRHLCKRLLDEGASVICVDNFFTGCAHNIAELIGHPRFSMLRHDVTRPLHVDVDQIYNLACPASPVHYQYDPVHTLRTSVQGALNILELARRCGATVLQASTSEVYGDPERHPQPEEYWGHVNPHGVRACYDEGKRCAEALMFDYQRQYGVPIKVARIFNTYGPFMQPNDGRVVSNLILQALQRQPLTLYGDGSQTRSFCYVDDLIEGLVRLMAAPPEVPGPVNLGNPIEYRMIDLAQMIVELTASTSIMEWHPLPADDPRRRRPAIERAQALLGWEPRVPLHEGLERTVAYFAARLAAPSRDSEVAQA